MEELCRLVAGILGVNYEEVGPESGPGKPPKWDSLAHIQLVAAMEETYKVQMSMEEIVNLLSVNDIANLLRARGVELG